MKRAAAIHAANSILERSNFDSSSSESEHVAVPKIKEKKQTARKRMVPKALSTVVSTAAQKKVKAKHDTTTAKAKRCEDGGAFHKDDEQWTIPSQDAFVLVKITGEEMHWPAKVKAFFIKICQDPDFALGRVC